MAGEYILGRDTAKLTEIEQRFLGFAASRLVLPDGYDHRLGSNVDSRFYAVTRDTPPTLRDPVDTIKFDHSADFMAVPTTGIVPGHLFTSLELISVRLGKGLSDNTGDLMCLTHLTDNTEAGQGKGHFAFNTYMGDMVDVSDEALVAETIAAFEAADLTVLR